MASVALFNREGKGDSRVAGRAGVLRVRRRFGRKAGTRGRDDGRVCPVFLSFVSSSVSPCVVVFYVFLW